MAVANTTLRIAPSPGPSERAPRGSESLGITAIGVHGYKSISDPVHLGVRRLTILAGANSSGKSSVIQPLLLLKQTLEAPFDPGALRISGPNVLFTSADQFLSRTLGTAQVDRFYVMIEHGRKQRVEIHFVRDPKEAIAISEMTYHSSDERIALSPGLGSSALMEQLQRNREYRSLVEFLQSQHARKVTLKVQRNRCFLEIRAGLSGSADDFGLTVGPTGIVAKSISQTIHVPGLRGNPERTYKTSAVAPAFPGLFNDYVASIIHSWKTTGDERLRMLATSLRDLGLTWKVDTRQVDDTRVEVRVGRLPKGVQGGARDTVNIADVGFGVSQTLPVIVALLAAKPGQLVYIEQPEIHLHPRAQVRLADILVQVANRGARIVVETHSSLLVLSLQSLVARGEIDPQHVALHWFTRRPQDGATQISSTRMDKQGAYGDWPIDFGEVELELQDRYVGLAQRVKN